MKNLKIKLGLFCLLAILAVSVFFTACEQELITSEQVESFTENADNAELSAPQLSDAIEGNSELESRAANFDYPQNNQPLDYGGWYMYRASYNSSSSRSAILVRQNGKDFWNDYWGADGVNRTHNIITGSYAHNQLEIGEVEVFLWHRINGSWAYQGKIRNYLRLNWVNPIPGADKITSAYGPRDPSNIPFSYCLAPYNYDCFHSGVDFGTKVGLPEGLPVYAVAAGQVVESACDLGSVTILHNSNGFEYMTRYRHLRNSSLKPLGRTVAAGERIGVVAVGFSNEYCNNEYFPHLHFEYFESGNVSNINDNDNTATNPAVNICYSNLTNITEAEINSYQLIAPPAETISYTEYCARVGVSL